MAARLEHSGVLHRADAATQREDAMARLVVMYRIPKDAGAFDKHYFERHVPLAKTIPGLRKYEISRGPVLSPAGPSGFHLIATLHFDDIAAIQAAFASPQGLAAAADVAGFATGGADMLIFESAEV
jgi:uncharacterized protein (TIGR02118 family)